MALTQDMILTFLLERGGKVKNSELVSKFKGLINSSDPAEKKQNRELFKRLVNNVAVVKQVDDVKYVAVKKKHQGFITGEKLSFTESPCSSKSTRDSSEIENVDIINNNYCHCHTPQTVSNSSKSAHDAEFDYNATESLTARVLSVTADAKSGKTGAVFALVAIKSPLSELRHDAKGKTSLDAEPPPAATAERTLKVKACVAGEGFLYRSLRAKRKELEAQGSPQLRRCSKLTRSGGNEAKASDEIPLGPMEHEWLVKSATGCWRQIYSLLLKDPQLAAKPNFMSGFTILHWAAKSGNGEMVCKVIDVSRQRGDAGIDVNAKSYDGYTALHIAAIHSRERVISLLVCEYGANTNIRDNSGKKPYHYLNPDVSVEIRKMLGDPHSLQRDAQNHSDLPKGFNTLGKLFQPHITGQKKKYRRRPSFHFVRDDHEDPRKNVAINRKLLQ
ncbi:ankyrin repeat domain-containing SOWAHA [Labeo rohita]|uniref:Ankyrin repeat domain-containing SOWAHA n=2 Tax=Labeo rohita TaxID=84645 RepID=A0A498NTE5_LABRO|nr:ankyrin repeat domain-containing protein SOWAHA [Labeo rohita]KAI2656701.1 Ankyrin repeat domain-containing protein SOWAHA [Labeo rohita]RXN35171.1 ankyrin repeat domain-containing SOWAHA [Labeo rohita]